MSRTHDRLVIVSASAAALAICLIEAHLAVQLLMLLLLSIYAFRSHHGNRPLIIQFLPDGSWWLDNEPAQLSTQSILTSRFCLLVFRMQNGQLRRLPVFTDSLDEDDFRRLRVKLKVEGFAESRDKIAR